MFKRKAQKIISDYLDSNDERILVIDGARQIGKSYIIRNVCKEKYKNYIEINLQEDFDGDKLFANVSSITSFYFQLSMLYGNKLNNREDTLIFLDEIQVYPKLFSLLKPLRYDNRYRYIASGSLLGVTLKKAFIPMGSIFQYHMFPMDFEEFLWANNVGNDVINYLKECYQNKTEIDENIHKTMLIYFKRYLISGGLPDAISALVNDMNIQKVRNIQKDIYQYYQDDSSKYDQENKLKISRIYSLLPSYMENKVKRIRANQISSKNKDYLVNYQDEFDYLISSGISLAVKAISDPKFPLIQSMNKNLIKLYYNDVGILSNILFSSNVQAILNMDKGMNLGSVYETACAMELKAHGHELYYYDQKKVGEVDFLIDDYENLSVLPLEIKSGNDQTNFRALPKLLANNEYHIKEGIVLGNKNIVKKEDKLITLPIYMIMFL